MEEILNPASLTLPKERKLFVITLVFSCLVWLVCVLTIVPIVAVLLTGGIIWFIHGLLIARIKSEAVKLDINQTPRLSHVFTDVCARLGVAEVPDLYLIQAGGVLNAFATRFCARDFVVLYSDLLEAYGPDSGEIRFLLGHEIGHIRSKHIIKNMFLMPGLFLPLLGSAYNRACESSCDRHGAYASQDEAASVRAMMILSGGKEVGRNLLADAFSNQHHAARGFFVSLHELLSSYPTMSKRVSDLVDLQKRQNRPRPARNPFAYPVALFCPGARFGALGILISFYIVVISLTTFLPAANKVRQEAKKAMEESATELEDIGKIQIERQGEDQESPEPSAAESPQ